MKRSGIIYGLLLCCFVNISCETGPYLKHGIELKKANAGCPGRSGSVGMVSNTSGERFTFQECLHAGFRKEDAVVERRGDTVLVKLRKEGSEKALFDVVLDINTWPRYRYLVIGENIIPIVPAGN